MPGGALESSSDESNKISSIFVGQKLDEHRGAFYLEYPMDKGMVTESGWNSMTRLWEVRFGLLSHLCQFSLEYLTNVFIVYSTYIRNSA